MDRRTFARLSAASVLCAPNLLSAQRARHVTVIGAGSAGLTAAYHLTRAGTDVRIIEAADVWGGRLKRLSGLASVPLDLGAEWIHDEPGVLGRILGQGETDLGVETISFQPQTYQFWHRDELRDFNLLRYAYSEAKFRDTTWFGFFENFVLPSVRDQITLNATVSRISMSGQQVAVGLGDGRMIETDKVLITVPLSVLQRGDITFSDNLAPPDLAALRDIVFGSGFKAFLTFRERFYPDILFEGPRASILADSWAEKIYYDAAFDKPTSDNILGLFTVSDGPLPRVHLDDATLLDDILAELSMTFGPVVRDSFIEGVVQNWSAEPHIMGSYSMENASGYDASDILTPVQGRVFFAGEVLGGAHRSTVHGAAFSAIASVDQMLAG